MKNFTTLLLLFTVGFIQAQPSFEAPPEYGKLWNFVYHPTQAKTLFALTYGNHILVSRDNGLHWEIFYAYPSTSATLWDLRLAPGNQALSFVAENSGYETQDGLYVLDLQSGEVLHHFAAPNWDRRPFIQSYSLFDHTFQHVLLHTSFTIDLTPFTEVYYSSDAGISWPLVYGSIHHNDVHINEAAISPANPAILFLTRGHGPGDVDGGILKSLDGGTTWRQSLDGVILGPLAFHPENPNEMMVGTGIAFGAVNEALYRSTDGGDSWLVVPAPWAEGILDNIVTIVYNPSNPNEALVLEENEIVVTTDGGTTWTHHVYGLDDVTYYYGTGAAFDPATPGHVIIANDYFARQSYDLGTTLTPLPSPFYNVHHATVADYGTSKHIYFGSQGGYFEKNLNTGALAAYDIQDPTTYNLSIQALKVDEHRAGRVFIFNAGNGFMSGTLSFSDDYGATTSYIMSEFAADMPFVTRDPQSPEHYWASLHNGFTGRLYDIHLDDPLNPVVNEIYINDEGVITGMQAGDDGSLLVSKGISVFRSVDNGVTWVEKNTGLEALSAVDVIWHMAVNPLNSEQLALSTTLGLFTTDDGGETWMHRFDMFETHEAAYSPYHPGLLIAMNVQSSEVIHSIDGGESWSVVSGETMQYLRISDIDFHFGADAEVTAYAATYDLGLVSIPLTNFVLETPGPVAEATDFTLFPNPAETHLTIRMNNAPMADVITILDVHGNILSQHRGETIDVSALTPGIYIIQASANTGIITTKRFIKQ